MVLVLPSAICRESIQGSDRGCPEAISGREKLASVWSYLLYQWLSFTPLSITAPPLAVPTHGLINLAMCKPTISNSWRPVL
ncbi:hypothetical protein F441_05305 [Phytophthora nicotianae CJ01A1]|nr:hypothetical protein L915_05156 [Phytophthora nicotianae]ETO80069.1 hypothetical protein F444_05345 [Phytophthora nicotianae P1976]ETP21116.1 hypothetical protein F441_05305 [Phytophthora nicotianae CJ01A1]